MHFQIFLTFRFICFSFLLQTFFHLSFQLLFIRIYSTLFDQPSQIFDFFPRYFLSKISTKISNNRKTAGGLPRCCNSLLESSPHWNLVLLWLVMNYHGTTIYYRSMNWKGVVVVEPYYKYEYSPISLFP